MEDFFELKKHGTNVSTEVMAGITTYFSMVYIIFVNPAMLSQTGMPYGAVFLSTILASVVGTLIMGLFANVPYAQAPGMGLNALFTFTVVFSLGFKWQEALAMVFICGILNIIITVTKIRKMLIRSIPDHLQNAIGGGIGLFVAYVGIKNAGWLEFTVDVGQYVQFDSGTVVANSTIVPALVDFNSPTILLSLFGLILTIVLLIFEIKGAILIGIVTTTLLSIPDFSSMSASSNLSTSFQELGTTFMAALGQDGIVSLFSDTTRLPLVFVTIFAFTLSDIFDTVGTFIGTGRKTQIFSKEDEIALENGSGFQSKMDKALLSDAVATTVGALFGTSNVTTYVESAAGITAGGRTGLTSVVTAILFLLSIFLAPIAGFVPAAATAPALIIVGVMMSSSFKDIEWEKLEIAIPSFFCAIMMCLTYSISNGIAFGFIFYCIIKICKSETKEIHPIIYGSSILFLLNFIISAIL